jgi:hypothetical protein
MLPMVPSSVFDRHFDEKTRIKDSDVQYKMKCYTDTRNRAENRNIKVRDSVLMKRDQYKGKLQPMLENFLTLTAWKE